MKNATLLVTTILLSSCMMGNGNAGTPAEPETMADASGDPATRSNIRTGEGSGLAKAYFASGCFWCVEAIFESVRGVEEAVSGYSGGTEKDPTYEQVAYGMTGHAEAVEVVYDPEIIGFYELVQVFFGSHDPTTPNRQGPDRGAQYRSIAFYQNEAEREIILAYIEALNKSGIYGAPIVTEVTPFTTFYQAEDYHQDYERKNPYNPYVQNVSIPRLNRFKANFKKFLKTEAEH